MKIRTLTASAVLLLGALALSPASAQTLPAIFAGNAPGDGIYIDEAYLNGLLGQPQVKVVDIREPDAYAAGHIAGAINIPNTVLSIEANGLANELPTLEARQAVFAQAGLSYDDTIVIYGDNLAGRSYIAFDQSGFENVHILEGGITGWDGALSAEAIVPTPSDFVLDRSKIDVVDKAYVLAHLDTPGVVIIDSRGAESFAAGSIPGSINIPIGVSHDRAAVPGVEDLVAALEAAGITPDLELILTCGTGNVASNQLAALRDLGYTNLRLYDGSWSEWGADPETPKTVAAAG